MGRSKQEADIINSFLNRVRETGMVSRGDVVSIESLIPGLVTDKMNINNFTSVSTRTGVTELLRNVVSEEVLDKTVGITEFFGNLDILTRNIFRLFTDDALFNDMKPINSLYDEAVNGLLTSTYRGTVNTVNEDNTRDVRNTIDDDFSFFINDKEVVDRLITRKTKNRQTRINNSINDYNSILLTDKSSFLPLINRIISGKHSILSDDPVPYATYTTRDIIDSLIRDGNITNFIKQLKKDITMLKSEAILEKTDAEDTGRGSWSRDLRVYNNKVLSFINLLNDNKSMVIIIILSLLFTSIDE